MSALPCLLVASLARPARADEAGRAWLARIDAAAHVDDIHLVLDVRAIDPRGNEARRTLEIWQKGDDRRLVRLTAPPRLAGVGLLVTHGDTVHLYLPEYPPARRVTGRHQADAFMGTDFAIGDLSRLRYADRYDAVIVGTTGAGPDARTELALTPTGDDDPLRLVVGADAAVREVTVLDGKGEAVRRIAMDAVRPEGGVLLAHELAVEDLRRGRRTEATVREVAVNTGLSDELFTVSSLESP